MRRAPRSPKAHLTLGHSLLAVDDPDGAARAYLRALTLDPDYAKAHRSLATLQREAGAVAEAAAHYRQATHFEPSAWGSHNDLAWLLATHPELPRELPREAVVHAEHAVTLTGGERATVLDTLAVAQASVGDYAAAAATAARALARARVEGAPELTAEIETHRAHFARGEVWPAGANP